MLPWQRRTRLAVAAIGVACAVAVFVTTRHREPRPAPPTIPRVDPSAVVESTGAIVRQVKGTKEHFRIEAEHQLTYASGATKLTGVKVSVERGGQDFVVSGREAEVGPNESTVSLNGDVRLASSDGLTATADSASYSDAEGIVRAPGQVAFARGRMTGTGVGMTYDKNRDVLWILDQAAVKVAPDATGAGALGVKAGAAGLARREKYLRFERGVTIVREGRVIEAAEAVAHLTEDEARVTSVELRGNSRLSTVDSMPGSLKGMTARDMNLVYAEDGERLQHAVLSGAASMQIGSDKSGGDRRISAESLELGLATDGATLTSLTGRDRVLLEFPSERGVPARTIRATSLVGSGEPGRGLTAATFGENVEYRETGGTPPVQRIVRSQTLALSLGAGFAEIQDARFSGGVRFDDADVHASAATADYLVGKGVVELSGDIGSTTPRVADDQITVDAKRIDLTLEGPKMRASQGVRSAIQASTSVADGGGAHANAPPRKVPGIMQQDQPVYATGDALSYDGTASQAVYTGHARMWQGDTAVQGEILSVDGHSGNLTATGDVRSALTLEQVNEKTKARETVATVATARELQYDDTLRRATYRTEARVNGPQGDLRANTIELYLAPSGHELERAEGYEQVSLRQGARSATGERLTYFAADERYVMAGAPVRISEECRETTGKTLTFFRSTDRIVIDGNEEIRTQTKSGGDCPGPRFE